MDLTNFTKICKLLLTSVSFVVGQLPPVFFICFIISFLWLRNFLHWNIKWFAICSFSSSQEHILLSISTYLWRYDRIFACTVTIIVNSGNIWLGGGRNRREGNHWGDLGVDGWIILGRISRRWNVGIWTGLGWPRIDTGGGRLWVR